MNTVTIRSNQNNIRMDDNPRGVKHTIHKFLSIIHADNELLISFRERKVLTWLKNKEAEVENTIDDIDQFRDLYIQHLRISSESSSKKIHNRLKIALVYAKVVEKYHPDERGDIGQSFDYYQLIWLVKTVFREHIRKNEAFSKGGIKIGFTNCSFYAKLEGKRTFIILENGKPINTGGHGTVSKVLEITSKKFVALKVAHENDISIDLIKAEISNLKSIHEKASQSGLSLGGIQNKPHATFDISLDGKRFIGFIGRRYGIDLYNWCDEPHSNAERILVCKRLMAVYENILNLGYWHGDIKLDNALMTQKGLVIIDWAGSLSMQEVSNEFEMPNAKTRAFLDLEVYNELLKLEVSCDDLDRFIQLAQSLELFSVAITMFNVLTNFSPFHCDNEGYSESAAGICHDSRKKFLERKYSQNVLKVIFKMLSADPKDRYTPLEAIEVWEKMA